MMAISLFQPSPNQGRADTSTLEFGVNDEDLED
jgi:hypothetical protein